MKIIYYWCGVAVSLIGLWMLQLSICSAQTGVCYSSRLGTESYSAQTTGSRNHKYRCSRRWWRRCSRTVYFTSYNVAYRTAYFRQFGCCTGYTNVNGECKRVVIGFERTNIRVNENVGTVSICATIQTSVGIEYGRHYTVYLTTRPGVARSPSDYTRVYVSKSFTSSSRRQCTSVPIIYDYIAEGIESFRVTLSRHSSLPSYVTLSRTTCTVVIRNTNRLKIGFEQTSLSVHENGANINVCTRILQPNSISHSIPSDSFMVQERTTPGNPPNGANSSDFTSVSRAMTFNTSSRRHCINVPITYDYMCEDREYFTVHLTGHLPSYVILYPNITRVWIYNSLRVRIGFEKANYFLEVNRYSISICIKIHQPPSGCNIEDRNFIVELQMQYNGPPRVTGSYTEIEILTPSIRRQCININIAREQLTNNSMVVLSNFSLPSYVTLSPRTAAIRSRPRVTIGFEETRLTTYEDAGNVTVCVRILDPSNLTQDTDDLNYQINLSTEGRSALDFVPVNLWVTLNASSQHQCKVIEIIHDHIHEEMELCLIVISNDDLPSHVTLSPDTARIKILNTRREFTIGFDLQDIEVEENSGETRICVSGPEAINGMITMEVGIPFSHTRDISFLGSTSHRIQFNNSSNQSCVNLTIIDDTEFEADETVTLTLEIVSMTQPFYMRVNPSFLNIKILDDDALRVGFENCMMDVNRSRISPTRINVCVRANRWKTNFRTIDLSVRTSNGLAVRQTDYFPIYSTISLSLNSPRHCSRVLITPNSAMDRVNKTFIVSLTPLFPPPYLILEQQSVLIRIAPNQGSPACGSSTPSDWTEWSVVPRSGMSVSKCTCQSEQTIIKRRTKSGINCSEKGQFCVPSMKEKIIRNFRLGISTEPWETTSNHSISSNCSLSAGQSLMMNSNPTSYPTRPQPCVSSRPQVCGNRSILFVLDSSASVGAENFRKMTSAVAELTKHMCGNVKVAVVKFNGNTFLDLCFDCFMNSRYNLSQYIRNNITYQSNGENARAFGSAICSHLFGGDHSTSDCIDIIYITGGQSNTGPPVCNEVQSLKHSLPLRDSICNKTRVYAIGIGTHLNTTELRCIADNPVNGQDTVFQFPSFNDFKKTIGKSVQYMHEKKIHCQREEPNSECDGRLDIPCN